MSHSIKDKIIDYIYDHVEINDQRYALLKNVSDVYELRNRTYYVSANTCGINSLLVFMKHNNEYYSYLVDRRSMSYNRHSLDRSKVKLSEIKIKVDEKYYNGTILDGIWIDNIGMNTNTIHFMVTDVFMLFGTSFMTRNYKHKMFLINNLINELDMNGKCKLYVSRPYDLNDIKSLFFEYINPNVKNYNIKGITFYPEISSKKLIYLFDREDENVKSKLIANEDLIIQNKEDDDYDMNKENENTEDKRKVFRFELKNAEHNKPITHHFEIVKTQTPDVYKLFGIFQYSNKFIKKMIGLPYIPTYQDSLKCKTLFLDKNSIIMECLYVPEFGKWKPMNVSNENKIDIINKSPYIHVREEYEDILDEN